ncbi:MAG TPA: HEAT repeat domain-containing protein [Blastocatellia bacterium]|nr:HEAT repeat domain-containing protein [Blastocatellia bacterium]
MNDNQPIPDEEYPSVTRRTPSRKYPWAILVVVILFVIVPFISWYGTWFGRPLSDSKMQEYLHDQNKPRNVQHALSQIANRIVEGDQTVKRFYPDVVAASQNKQPEVRMTAAWTMGQDNTYQDFHPALLLMLQDSIAGVRHNAALGLVRFGDSSGRQELIAMLKPYAVRAGAAGVVELVVKEPGVAVAANGTLARLREPGGNAVEIHASEAGRVESVSVANGATVEAEAELMTLAPATEQVWEALRALFIVGTPEDIPEIQRYTRPSPTIPDRIEKQAAATIEAIRDRGAKDH